jgi:hypothetical protein
VFISAQRSERKRLNVAATQDEASPLEHRMRDVWPGQGQMGRKRARPWRCNSARPRRKRGRGKRGGRSGSGGTTRRCSSVGPGPIVDQGRGAPGGWCVGPAGSRRERCVGRPRKRNGVGRAQMNSGIFDLFKRISSWFDSF